MANLPYTRGIQVAMKVLAIVRNRLKGKKLGKFNSPWVEAYDNCREQGFTIQDSDLHICFSEYRNSDSIVVYSCVFGDTLKIDGNGRAESYPFPTNIPTDGMWRSAKMFPYGAYNTAADYIVSRIVEWSKIRVKNHTEKTLAKTNNS